LATGSADLPAESAFYFGSTAAAGLALAAGRAALVGVGFLAVMRVLGSIRGCGMASPDVELRTFVRNSSSCRRLGANETAFRRDLAGQTPVGPVRGD
jgi:hypothetical protein